MVPDLSEINAKHLSYFEDLSLLLFLRRQTRICGLKVTGLVRFNELSHSPASHFQYSTDFFYSQAPFTEVAYFTIIGASGIDYILYGNFLSFIIDLFDNMKINLLLAFLSVIGSIHCFILIKICQPNRNTNTTCA